MVYKDQNGKEIKANAILNTGSANIGDVFTVRYLKETPNEVYRSPTGILATLVDIAYFGCPIIAILSIVMMIVNRRKDGEIVLHEEN